MSDCDVAKMDEYMSQPDNRAQELVDVLTDARQWLVGYTKHIRQDHTDGTHEDVTWGAGFSVDHIERVIKRIDDKIKLLTPTEGDKT